MKLSIKNLASVIATYVDENKISVANFQETRNNTVGLLDTIGKIFTITHNYVDKLEAFDGEFLSFGKTIEEWANDLILCEDYRPNGERAMSPHKLTYRPVYFSYTLGRKVIPLTIRNNDIERAVHNEGQFVSIIEGKTKALADSKTMMKYAIKRQLLGVLSALAISYMDSANADHSWVATSSDGWADDIASLASVGEYVAINMSTPEVAYPNGLVYQVVRPIASDSTLTLDQLITQGYLVKMDLVERIAKPVDTATSEDFALALKKAVEVAEDFSEGRSLNGATLGATPTEGLYLVVKQGVMPTLDVKSLAGAFHTDKLAIPTKVVSVPNFGDADDKVYAILVDARGVKNHPTYEAIRENLNGDGDFLNMFSHYECTCFLSRNTYVRVFAEPEE